MHIARFLGDDHTVREQLARFVKTPKARQQLAKLKVTRHIRWMQFEKLVEMIGGGGVVTQLRAFQRESVTRKCVLRLFGDELLQKFAARFLSLGHVSNTRIITATVALAKRATY